MNNKVKAGVVCSAKNCGSKSYLYRKKSFFRFPKDPLRARTWAIAANREDLMSKLENLHKGYRLCSNHFEPQMFTNSLRNKLNINAVPTIFVSLEGSSCDNVYLREHNYSLIEKTYIMTSPEVLPDVVIKPAIIQPGNEYKAGEIVESPELLSRSISTQHNTQSISMTKAISQSGKQHEADEIVESAELLSRSISTQTSNEHKADKIVESPELVSRSISTQTSNEHKADEIVESPELVSRSISTETSNEHKADEIVESPELLSRSISTKHNTQSISITKAISQSGKQHEADEIVESPELLSRSISTQTSNEHKADEIVESPELVSRSISTETSNEHKADEIVESPELLSRSISTKHNTQSISITKAISQSGKQHEADEIVESPELLSRSISTQTSNEHKADKIVESPELVSISISTETSNEHKADEIVESPELLSRSISTKHNTQSISITKAISQSGKQHEADEIIESPELLSRSISTQTSNEHKADKIVESPELVSRSISTETSNEHKQTKSLSYQSCYPDQFQHKPPMNIKQTKSLSHQSYCLDQFQHKPPMNIKQTKSLSHQSYCLDQFQHKPPMNIKQTKSLSPELVSRSISTETSNEHKADEIVELPELLSRSIPTQTSNSLSSSTPRKRKYCSVIKSIERENKRLKAQVDELQDRLKNIENNITLDQYYNLTKRFCNSPYLLNFIKVQITQMEKEPKGRRYSKEFKTECLRMYFMGPKLYKSVLMENFCLPGPRCLFNMIKINSGLNNHQLFEVLSLKVNNFSQKDKHAVLCIGETVIKSNLFCNRDAILGFSGNEENLKTFQAARHVCVFMLRGIFSSWKQPIAYYFSRKTLSALSIKNILFQLLQILKKVGLKIVAVVTDMGSNFSNLKTVLNVTSTQPYFMYEEMKIFYIFDPPHIIKAIRNMLQKYEFYLKGNKVSWEYIYKFYEKDKKYPIRAAPKLTDAHFKFKPSCFEKVKVRYATQVFSATVAAGMNVFTRFNYLPADAIYTSDFVDKMDKLFDILNSSSASGKSYNRAYKGLEYQINFLKECLDIFDSIIVLNGKNENISGNIKCFKAVNITINSILQLWDELKKANFKCIFTRRLSQDCLEKLFSIVRQQSENCKNPTALQVHRTIRKLLYVNLFHSGTESRL